MSGLPIPLDIVFFVLVALVLGWRLFVVLGRRVRVEAVVTFQKKPLPSSKLASGLDMGEVKAATRCDIPQPNTRVGQVLQEIGRRISKFEPTSFVEEAQQTFRDVVTAFAAGDIVRLKACLTEDAFNTFNAVIEARQKDQTTQKAEIKAIDEVALEDAAISGAEAQAGLASIDVKFVSRQISAVYNADKDFVSGTESVTEFSELWRFIKPTGPDNTQEKWQVAAIRAA
ncbi:hypothetical protein CGLAMM_00990 [Acetobacteraceae bacterium EV16G]|uniref:Tim44-like domain-containing protein n=1 Tax=Sorlinia euscelidii TaxID=3081148 RepID=A0ABU7U464_9PROT